MAASAASALPLAPFLLNLILILATAKVFGEAAKRLGVPVVLGELLGGAVVGVHGFGWLHLDGENHLLAEIGLILLLFQIGLETDVAELLRLGPRSFSVATIGIITPLIAGFAFGHWMGLPPLASLLIGATFSATSIGISMRSLAEMGEHASTEGKIVLGAALIDDVVGLFILSIITVILSQTGEPLSAATWLPVLLKTISFPVVAFFLGSLLIQPLLYWVDRMTVRGAIVSASLILALALSWLAIQFDTSPIIGAFAAGLVLARTRRADVIEQQLKPIADIFTPIFFISIGAALNLHLLNPSNPANHAIILMAVSAALVAFLAKLVSGLGAYGKGIRKLMIGVSMTPLGEVGLLCAQLGLSSGILNDRWFAILILVIAQVAFAAPLLLKWVLGRTEPSHRIASYSDIDLAGFESDERL